MKPNHNLSIKWTIFFITSLMLGRIAFAQTSVHASVGNSLAFLCQQSASQTAFMPRVLELP